MEPEVFASTRNLPARERWFRPSLIAATMMSLFESGVLHELATLLPAEMVVVLLLAAVVLLMHVPLHIVVYLTLLVVSVAWLPEMWRGIMGT